MPKRISTANGDGTYRLTIASNKDANLIIGLGGWLILAPFFLFMTDRIFLQRDRGLQQIHGLYAFALFFAATLAVTFLLLWNLFGKEIITITGDALTIKKELFGVGKMKAFQISRIDNFRAAGMFGRLPSGFRGLMYQCGLSGGTVAFEINGETYRFGIQLDEDEAQEVVAELKKQMR